MAEYEDQVLTTETEVDSDVDQAEESNGILKEVLIGLGSFGAGMASGVITERHKAEKGAKKDKKAKKGKLRFRLPWYREELETPAKKEKPKKSTKAGKPKKADKE